MDLFSIVIPLYNKEKHICDAVESVLKQTYEGFELIIIDDGSTDHGFQAISNYIHDKRVQVFQQENAGVSSARNNGISHARNEYICFLDADDLWMPNHLEVLKELICQYPDAGLFATRHKLIEVDGTERIIPMGKELCLIDDIFRAELDTGYNYLNTNSVCIPHKILMESGLFDIGEITGEDTSVWLRIAARYNVAMAKPVTTIYRREYSNAFVGLALNSTWSFIKYSEQLLKLNMISDKKKDSIRMYINRYRISLCRHALLIGDKDNAKIHYNTINWSLQGKKEKLVTDICTIIPSTILRMLYHIRYRNFKIQRKFLIGRNKL